MQVYKYHSMSIFFLKVIDISRNAWYNIIKERGTAPKENTVTVRRKL